MKELALLMFFIGCGYVLSNLINYASPTPKRRFYFYIPSSTSFNILWGFVFYSGFGVLTVKPLLLKIILTIVLLFLLGYLCHQWLITRYFFKHSPKFMERILSARLQKQLSSDKILNLPYSPNEALRFLGLSTSQQHLNDKISTRLKLIETVPLIETETNCRHIFLSQIQQQLPPK